MKSLFTTCLLAIMPCLIADVVVPSETSKLIKKSQTDSVTRPLRVVYFYPKGENPLKNYATRLNRIMDDCQSYYREQMILNGYGPLTITLEKENDSLLIHLVEGQESATGYNHKTGRKVRGEVKVAMQKKGININQETTLIVCAMQKVLKDGSYVFDAPYYGGGGAIQGTCYVADCDIMDTLNLKNKTDKIVYKEHYGNRTQTYSEFNIAYLGGIAHELGHAFSLKHNTQSSEDKRTKGIALMGAGNHHYRRETVSKRKGTFITPTSAFHLASQPTFTQQTKLNVKRLTNLSSVDIKLKSGKQTLEISGKLPSTEDIYGLTLYCDPEAKKSDYDAISSTASLKEGGSFNFKLSSLKPDNYDLRINVCYVNGMIDSIKRKVKIKSDGTFEILPMSVKPRIRRRRKLE